MLCAGVCVCVCVCACVCVCVCVCACVCACVCVCEIINSQCIISPLQPCVEKESFGN